MQNKRLKLYYYNTYY
ncbi:hypothetical protein FOXB_17283 [Fusarium oxysporum f. sp. conglutinans Fo5176]|uniref:Uncharacterized protein n=1 Tax=Fusarium oxysporum (strain Fo5176) TaxID=660025 RepID=F9GF49_FUSOF|nr:hypothetical protein FOXB_17283 [Fusarium oxysporum f. sp. conglutinans Fo5176]